MTDFALPQFFYATNLPEQLPAAARKVLNIQDRLEKFERLEVEGQADLLSRRLVSLLTHAKRDSPFWRERLQSWSPGKQSLDEILSSFPPLTRNELQSNYDDIVAHFPQRKTMHDLRKISSGSTGTPVRVEHLAEHFRPAQYAARLRESAWHKIDPTKSLGRLSPKFEDNDHEELGLPFCWFGLTGIGFSRCLKGREEGEIYDYCASKTPAYLLTGVPTFTGLARHAIRSGRCDLRPEILLSYGSAVTQEAREIVREGLGAKIIDRYSAEETGIIAIQCPKHDRLHVQSPVTLVEIVDENNAPCPVGQPGRVLVTVMQSYGMPLVRYDIGDVAEWGEPCGCGIMLPVIKQLWGRTRQLMTHPDGRTTFARIYARDFEDLHDLQEYRFVLHKNDVIVAQLKVKALSPELTAAITERAQRAVGYPYDPPPLNWSTLL